MDATATLRSTTTEAPHENSEDSRGGRRPSICAPNKSNYGEECPAQYLRNPGSGKSVTLRALIAEIRSEDGCAERNLEGEMISEKSLD